jgi:hypothetical protein
MRVDLAQERLQIVRHRRQHQLLHAAVVLGDELVFELVALVETQRERQRPVVAEFLELLDAVLQDAQRLEARAQAVVAGLQLDHLVQVGLHVLHQLPVAQVRPGPSAEQEPQHGDEGEEAHVAHACLHGAGELPHRLLVGKDHLGEQVAQEESVLRIDLLGLGGRVVQREPEALGDALGREAAHRALLQRAGEVEAAEHRLVLERIALEQRGQEGAQRRLDGREFERKDQELGRRIAAAMVREMRDADFLQAHVELVEALVELGDGVLLLVAVVGQRGAPHAVALHLVAVAEELRKAGDQVGLGEHHVDRREHLQPLGQLLHALAQVLGQLNGEVGPAADQLGNARGDDDPVDRRLRPVLLEQVEKAEPLLAVFLVNGIAARGVEHDAFGGEEPVAVARAADALDHRVALVGERELQARVQDGAALARRRVADDHVPGQLVQRLAARHLADLGRLDGLDGLDHAPAQLVDLGLALGVAVAHGGIGLVFEHVAELAVGRAGAHAPHEPHEQPQQQQHGEDADRPDRADLERLRADQEERAERDGADHREGARIGQETEESPHRCFWSRSGLSGLWHGFGGSSRGRPAWLSGRARPARKARARAVNLARPGDTRVPRRSCRPRRPGGPGSRRRKGCFRRAGAAAAPARAGPLR